MNKKGFTMAEVVIALMIVGAMMVILFPIIRNSAPDKEKIMFRKSFNSLSQAISNMQFDDANYPESQTGTTTDTLQTVPKGFNNQPGTYTAGTKFCTLLADQFNTVGTVTCGVSSTSWGTFTTSDGVDWLTHEGPANAADFTTRGYACTPADTDCGKSFPMNMSTHAYQSKIIIDINGASIGPNCSSDSNAQLFPYGNGGAAISRCSWYAACNGGTIPSGTKTADIYIIGVRFDGSLHLGSGDVNDGTSTTDTDKCGTLMLADPTTNTQ